jgi:hypothetical protein
VETFTCGWRHSAPDGEIHLWMEKITCGWRQSPLDGGNHLWIERVSCVSCFPAISVTGGTGFGGSGLLLAKNSSSEMPETINNLFLKNIFLKRSNGEKYINQRKVLNGN